MAIPCHDANILLRDGLAPAGGSGRTFLYRLWRRRGGDAAALRQIGNAGSLVALDARSNDALRACTVSASTDAIAARSAIQETVNKMPLASISLTGQSITGCERKFGCALKQIPSWLHYLKRSTMAWNFVEPERGTLKRRKIGLILLMFSTNDDSYIKS